ncbi:cupin domain-containing protein [Rhodobaculum claviforme]|uniref:Transcriptional regulator n=1 Tax=Rhodobaculum claviforme TaxID=1549854 RepID=A0A934TGJ8_9RHOB|nr:cupin domain-containing protein [Rhodobaculum claviforme]MBK5925885.1 transcriptional regulator [Rhodobaculum claviforme]
MPGNKLRAARRRQGRTLKAVAAAAGVSEGHLSKIETGKAVPSLPVLHRIAGCLGLNLGHLFDDAGGPSGAVTRAGARPVISLDPLRSGPGVTLERVIPHAPDNALQCNIHIMERGGASDGQISHLGEEVGIILEGQVELRLDDEVHVLGPGDSFHFRSDRRHGYRNVGEGRARIFWVNTPPTF